MKKTILDAEEKDILDSYERGEWKPVKNPKAEIKKTTGVRKEYTTKRQENKYPDVIKGFRSGSGYCCSGGYSLPDTHIQHHP